MCLLCGFWIGFGFLASVAVVGMTFFREERERERERGIVGVVTFEIWVLFFLSEFERRKESVHLWVFFSFFLGSGIVFLVFRSEERRVGKECSS